MKSGYLVAFHNFKVMNLIAVSLIINGINTKRFVSLAVFITLAVSPSLSGQQVADTSYKPEIVMPAYVVGKGPVVLIDEGHFNFNTREGR